MGSKFFGLSVKVGDRGMNYERRVYSVFDILGDVGGLNDALTLICQILVSFFTGSAAYADAVTQIFPVQKKVK
jgi:hypothetical protein